ncbi:MAG: ribosomal protein S18-alanine N-acetyltransferase [Pyrinomonadaceae bacterium]
MELSDETCHDRRIRPVEAVHIGDLIEIGEETKLSPWTAQNYLDELKNENSIMLRLIAEYDNSIVGFLVGRLVPGGEIEPCTDAEIYNIAVKRAEQGKGCGQALFDAFAGICRQRGIASIWLEVRESNALAISFYERNGFTRVQTRNHFYENPREHAILMKLILKQYEA